MKKNLTLIIILIASLLYFGHKFWSSNVFLNDKSKQIILDNYPKTLDSIKISKLKLQNKSIKTIGQNFTNDLIDKIFPYWYGTDWDFNGTTQKPNEGKIACGYFVTTTLQHVGLEINRTKLAQCASEEMIESLVSNKNIYRFSNKSINDFEKSLEKIGNGLYVVGLDNHTGFVLISDNGNFFIHASGIPPYEVVKDELSNSTLIVNSKYRVVGHLSSDEVLLKQWIKN